MLVFVTLACIQPEYAALEKNQAKLRAAPFEPGPEWVVGDVEACEGGPSAPSWTDHSGLLDGVEWDRAPIEGSLSLRVEESGWVINALAMPDRLLTWRSDGSVETTTLWPPATRFMMADLDGDGAEDLVTSGDEVLIIWSQGTPEESVELLLPRDGQVLVHDIEAVDIDGDGDLDLLGASMTMVEVDISVLDSYGPLWRNEGDRRLVQESWGEDMSLWGAPFDLVVGDLNNDGAPDAYLCNDFGPQFGGNFSLLNDGTGHLEPAPVRGLEVSSTCMGVSQGDLDRSGGLDMYIGAVGEQFVMISAGDGYYNATASLRFPHLAPLQAVWGTQITDLDNDGRADVLVASSDHSVATPEFFPLLFARQQEDGTFREEGAAFGFPQDTGTRTVLTRDLNGDGVQDMVVGDMSRAPWVYLSDGCTQDSWLELTLPEGTIAIVETELDTHTVLSTRSPGVLHSQQPVVHVGLGGAERVERIVLLPQWSDEVVLEGPFEPRRRMSWEPSP